MSTLKVGAVRGVSASSDAITVDNDGTCTANITNIPLKNLFLNGALDVAQRGDSYSSANAYMADQWYCFATGSTSSRLTTSPPDGFTHYIRFPSATNSIIFTQQIELEAQGKVGKYKNKTVTVSWYARSESSNKMYVDAAFKNASGGGDYTTIVSGSGSPQDITSSWARYSQTFTISATPHANNKCFSIMIRTPSSGAGSTGTLELTGFQAEFGSVATDFEHRPLSQELALCQRYFYQATKIGSTSDVTNAPIAPGFYLTGSDYRAIIDFPVEMRAAPTLSSNDTSNSFYIHYNANADFIDRLDSFYNTKRRSIVRNTAHTGGTQGYPGFLHQETGDSNLNFSAEL